MKKEIIITVLKENNKLWQIAFLEDDIYTDVEPFEFKHHSKYLNQATFKLI